MQKKAETEELKKKKKSFLLQILEPGYGSKHSMFHLNLSILPVCDCPLTHALKGEGATIYFFVSLAPIICPHHKGNQ